MASEQSENPQQNTMISTNPFPRINKALHKLLNNGVDNAELMAYFESNPIFCRNKSQIRKIIAKICCPSHIISSHLDSLGIGISGVPICSGRNCETGNDIIDSLPTSFRKIKEISISNLTAFNNSKKENIHRIAFNLIMPTTPLTPIYTEVNILKAQTATFNRLLFPSSFKTGKLSIIAGEKDENSDSTLVRGCCYLCIHKDIIIEFDLKTESATSKQQDGLLDGINLAASAGFSWVNESIAKQIKAQQSTVRYKRRMAKVKSKVAASTESTNGSSSDESSVMSNGAVNAVERGVVPTICIRVGNDHKCIDESIVAIYARKTMDLSQCRFAINDKEITLSQPSAMDHSCSSSSAIDNSLSVDIEPISVENEAIQTHTLTSTADTLSMPTHNHLPPLSTANPTLASVNTAEMMSLPLANPLLSCNGSNNSASSLTTISSFLSNPSLPPIAPPPPPPFLDEMERYTPNCNTPNPLWQQQQQQYSREPSPLRMKEERSFWSTHRSSRIPTYYPPLPPLSSILNDHVLPTSIPMPDTTANHSKYTLLPPFRPPSMATHNSIPPMDELLSNASAAAPSAIPPRYPLNNAPSLSTIFDFPSNSSTLRHSMPIPPPNSDIGGLRMPKNRFQSPAYTPLEQFAPTTPQPPFKKRRLNES